MVAVQDEEGIHDIFLTTDQGEALFAQLEDTLDRNAGKGL